jgi:hypothetical protein
MSEESISGSDLDPSVNSEEEDLEEEEIDEGDNDGDDEDDAVGEWRGGGVTSVDLHLDYYSQYILEVIVIHFKYYIC